MFTKDLGKRYIEFRGHSLYAHLAVMVDYDQVSPDFDFGNEAENQKYLERFNSGEMLNLVITVVATWQGYEGSDILGECHISSKNLEAETLDMITEHEMMDKACIDLVTTLTAEYDKAKQFVKFFRHADKNKV